MSKRFHVLRTSCAFVAGLSLVVAAGDARAAAAPEPIPDVCVAAVPIQPTGITSRPADNSVLRQEYGGMIASEHLQGEPSTRKLAAGFWEPAFNPADPISATLLTFHTFVTVVNPNDTGLNVEIRYRDRAGTLLQTNFRFIPAEGHWIEPAQPLSFTDGLGSIEVVSTAPTVDLPFVASTIHHTFQVWNVGDPLQSQPGMTSIQQMQEEQADSLVLSWGPLPITNLLPAAGADILQGMNGLWWLVNPTNQPNQVLILFDSENGISANAIVTIPPNGSLLDRTFWDTFLNFYLSPGFNFDDDFRVLAISLSGLPLIGEGLMIDIFGPNLAPGQRFRMASTIMGNTPAQRLVNPEFVSAPNAAGTQTFMGLMNVDPAARDIGPVSIVYHDRNGGVVASDVITNFPARRMARLGPGLPDSPNYPTGIFSGWVEITACLPGLAGWTIRANELLQQAGDFAKAWGEVLDGGNGAEPGVGFPVTRQGLNLVRKVATLNIVEPDNPLTPQFEQWPSYTNFLNDSVPNVGLYFYRFHDSQGNDVTNYLPQPFLGLRFWNTSFTYEDGVNSLVVVPQRRLTSGRTDHLTGSVRGIHAIGGHIYQYPWEEFYFPPRPTWNGPGDVVPPRTGL